MYNLKYKTISLGPNSLYPKFVLLYQPTEPPSDQKDPACEALDQPIDNTESVNDPTEAPALPIEITLVQPESKELEIEEKIDITESSETESQKDVSEAVDHSHKASIIAATETQNDHVESSIDRSDSPALPNETQINSTESTNSDKSDSSSELSGKNFNMLALNIQLLIALYCDLYLDMVLHSYI